MMKNSNSYGKNRSPRYDNQAPHNKGAMGVSGSNQNRTGANQNPGYANAHRDYSSINQNHTNASLNHTSVNNTDANAGSTHVNSKRVRNGYGPAPQSSRKYDDPKNLHDQATAARRQRQSSAPADFEKLRRVNKRRQFKIKKKRRKRIRMFIRRATAVLAAYFLLFTLSALILYANMNTYSVEEAFDYVYQTGIDIDPARHSASVSRKTVNMNDTRYINFSALADLCEMTVTGDSEQLRYIALNGEIVEFTLGSSLVYLNDVATRLNEVVVYKDGVLYVPMEFAQRYMLGVTATYNDETHRITVGRNGTFDVKGNFIYGNVSFIIKPQTPCSNIPLESLPYNIIAQTVLPQPEEPANNETISDTVASSAQ